MHGLMALQVPEENSSSIASENSETSLLLRQTSVLHQGQSNGC